MCVERRERETEREKGSIEKAMGGARDGRVEHLDSEFASKESKWMREIIY